MHQIMHQDQRRRQERVPFALFGLTHHDYGD